MIALFASLAVNFFAAGYLVHSVTTPAPPPLGPAARDFGVDNPRELMRFAAELSPESRRVFRRTVRDALPRMRSQFEQMRDHQEELYALMIADEWDGDAVAAKMAEISAMRTRQRDAFDAAFVEAFGAIPDADRQALIERARERRGERGGEHRRRFRERG
ncbi:MAG: periplasmic heavy metal sensor [Pseudomonadota bacterium]